ncbi:uncharacterized protein PAC_17980 [Phialocephala subalpina]|uniref:Uncharacterized protein n=1 Tax=Phialocephala subalpina TaxID=576137 RepID=A0A1L7XSR8_9HELO|nr:uncharacterized protein PAC_17980 [Phialocephala subalpina]
MQTSININRILTSLLLTTSMVLATPSPVNNTTTNGNLTIPTLQNRDQIATLTFPGVPPFQACLPFHDNNLCTLWAYDHTCQELGSAASVSIQMQKKDHVGTALHQAIRENRSEVVKVLLEDPRVDPSIFCCGDWGTGRPFDIAIKSGSNLEIIRLLIGNPKFDLESALHAAVFRGKLAVVSELMSSGRFHHVLGSPDWFGKTALQVTEERGHTEIAKLLQSAGAGSP